MKLFITAEHAGNSIPKEYKSLFIGKEKLLASHRGYDLGTLDLFEDLKPIADFSAIQNKSRLLIECNRSIGHKNLFSNITKSCDSQTKKALIETYYLPYRNSIEDAIRNEIQLQNSVLHISLHSFTPELNNQIRNNHIGLLYDPRSKPEKEFCNNFKTFLKTVNSELKIRYNYPYLGISDGLTSHLRKRFPVDYMGIELEINQSLVRNSAFPSDLKSSIKNFLKDYV